MKSSAMSMSCRRMLMVNWILASHGFLSTSHPAAVQGKRRQRMAIDLPQKAEDLCIQAMIVRHGNNSNNKRMVAS
jgi:hypothetical protein